MKSIKLLLTAVVLSAAFTACTKEEFTPVQELQNDEFVGAELVGTNLSVFIENDADTKVTASGDWEQSDKLGLGWVVSGSYDVAQSSAKQPTSDKVYANHMFELGQNGEFTTKGNVYVGWHFAYFPYKRMASMVDHYLTLDINPEQTSANFNWDYYNTALSLSARQFISNDNVDEKNDYQLKDTEDNALHFATLKAPKTIAINLEPSAVFRGKSALKDLAIKSVKVEADKAIFYGGKVNILPTELTKLVFDEDGKYDKEATNEAIYESFENAIVPVGSFAKNITTLVNNQEINLGSNQTLRIHTLPCEENDLNKAKVKFTITVENGFFTVQYIADEEDPCYSEKNNQAIEDLVEAYAEDGNMTAYGKKSGKQITFELTKAMFKANFKNITSEKVWNKAVAMVDALGMEDAEFAIAPGEDGKDWEFKDFDGDGELVNLPTNGAVVTVLDGGEMILSANGEWPAEGIKVETSVKVNKVLNVADNVKFEAKKITNKGTINAGVRSSISPVDNTGKVINVVYGSYITLINGSKAGTIAYNVITNETPARINTLLKGGNNGKYAKVNTLIINSGITFDMMMASTSITGTDPYYNQEVNTTSLEDLSNVNIEMKGGNIIGDISSQDFVKKVTAISGDNNIKDLNIATDLVVKQGANVTVDATTRSYGKKELAINGKVDVEGKLITNVSLNVNDVVNEKGTTVVNKPYAIWYKNSYRQGGVADGSIKEKSTGALTSNKTVTTLAELVSYVKPLTSSKVITINADTDQWQWSGEYDLKGCTILVANGGALKFGNASKDVIIKNATISAPVYQASAKTITFNGITFNSMYNLGSMGDAIIEIVGKTTFKNCIFDAPANYRALQNCSSFNGSLILDGCMFKSAIGQKNVNFNPVSTGAIKVVNCLFESDLICEFIGCESKFDIKDNTFEGMVNVNAGYYGSLNSTDELPSAVVSFCRALINNNDFYHSDKVAIHYKDNKCINYKSF